MILRRYLIREVLITFAAVLAALMLVFVAGRLADFLATAAAGRIGRAFLPELLGLRCVDALTTLLPAGFFAALVLALGRFGRDREIVAMAAGGVSQAWLAGTVLWIGAGFALAAAALSLVIAPAANERYESLYAHARHSAHVSRVLAGRFIRFRRAGLVFYVRRMAGEHGEMEQVFMHTSSGDADEVVFAPTARHLSDSGGRFMVLENGHRYVGVPGRGEWSMTRFGRYAIRLHEEEPEVETGALESVATSSLLAASRGDHRAAAELQWRLSQPVLTIVLAGIAFPLALSGAGRGPFERLLSGVASYLAYLGLVIAATKAVESGDIPPALGVWPVHAGFAAIAAAVWLGHLRGRRR